LSAGDSQFADDTLGTSAGNAGVLHPLRIPRFEVLQYEFRAVDEGRKFASEIASCGHRDFGESYLNGNCGCHLDIRSFSLSGSLETEFKEYTFVFKKIGGKRVNEGDVPRAFDLKFPVERGGNSGNDVQPPMPVLPGAVMNDFEFSIERGIFQGLRFCSVVGLYRLKPISERLREWRLVDGISIKGLWRGTDRKFDSVLIWGRFAAMLHDGNLVDCSVKSGAQLIKQLSQFKSNVVFGNHIRDGLNGATCPIAIHLRDCGIGCWIDYSLAFSLEG